MQQQPEFQPGTPRKTQVHFAPVDANMGFLNPEKAHDAKAKVGGGGGRQSSTAHVARPPQRAPVLHWGGPVMPETLPDGRPTLGRDRKYAEIDAAAEPQRPRRGRPVWPLAAHYGGKLGGARRDVPAAAEARGQRGPCDR